MEEVRLPAAVSLARPGDSGAFERKPVRLGVAGRVRRQASMSRRSSAGDCGRLSGSFWSRRASSAFTGSGCAGQLFPRWLFGQLLDEHAAQRPDKRRAPREHVPDRDAQAVHVRADIEVFLLQLLGAGILRRADEAAHRNVRAAFAARRRTRQAEVNDLDDETVLVVVLALDHDVGRLDVAVNEALLARRTKRAGNLQRDLERVGGGDRLAARI